MIRAQTTAVIAVAIMGVATTAAARAPEDNLGVPESIRYYESVAMMSSAAATSQAASTSSDRAAELSFDTLGRHFDLKLEGFDLLPPGATVKWVGDDGIVEEPISNEPFFRGRVDGDAKSWVRLTLREEGLTGIVATSDETYFLEPASNFFGAEAAGETLAYRLSDTDTSRIAGSCGTPHERVRQPGLSRLAQARAARKALHALLDGTAAQTQAASGTLKQADVGMVADWEYYSQTQNGGNSANNIAAIINAVDGIYQSEINVTLRLSKIVIYTTDQDPFSSVTDPSALLNEFGKWNISNRSNPSDLLYGTDVAHLISGRNFDGSVIGMAWIGAVCYVGTLPSKPTDPVPSDTGVDQSYTTATNLLTLLLAHEMGHNFGAFHDAQSNPSCTCCASSPPTFIMNPVLDPGLAQQFSTCSKSFINSYLGSSNASCLASVSPAVLNASPTTVAAGGTVTATWSAISNPSPADWIGLYAQGAGDSAFVEWMYVSCARTVGAAAAAGSCPLQVPATVAAGTYEFRLFANNGYTRLATSPSVQVNSSATLSASPTTVAVGGTVTVTWSGIASPSPADWIALYPQGAANTAYVGWTYVNCSKAAGAAAAAAGSCPLQVPATVAAGTYELRLFANNGFSRLATGPPVQVTSPASLSASPTMVSAGGTLTATWSGLSNPRPTDWIGLYVRGAPQSALLKWIYVSCSQTANAAVTTGSCPFQIPTGVTPGTYELRLFANNSTTLIVTGNAFSVQ